MQVLHDVLECELEVWYCPDPQPEHVRSAVVEQAVNLVPLPHVVVQHLHAALVCELEFWYCPDPQLEHARLAPEEQAVVCLFPVPQTRQALQMADVIER